MKNNTTRKMGHIILKGGTSEDVRKYFPDFPLNPTKEYFCNLGYTESTAKNYVWRLNKNNNQSVSSSSNDFLPDEEMFVKSGKIDLNNLLVDTCALGNEETLELIERAQHVTFIYSTIEEMDKKKKTREDLTPQEKQLAFNIRLYINKILEEREKYMLSGFTGIKEENYPDNILLQYMKILPTQIRPTLITADKDLAVKAEMYDLQYILFDRAKCPKRISLGYGIQQVISNTGKSYIAYNGEDSVYIKHEDGSETLYEDKRLILKPGDKVCIYLNQKVPKYVKLR